MYCTLRKTDEMPPAKPDAFEQLFDSAWQWTRSAYSPYPRYRPAAGAVGEYNGKFMVNQLVLRGVSEQKISESRGAAMLKCSIETLRGELKQTFA
jgi:hypothetical protein